eukprot:GHVH01008354.1.p1 GENE.GHVH01008354.1~~GHVH01008354.1.p1  ORF type:complete len:1164 (-),score=207.37 GHVH01008354.1:38-3529(-)
MMTSATPLPVVQAVDGFLSADKNVRDQCAELLEKGYLNEVLDGLLCVMEGEDLDKAQLAAVLLRKRIVKDEEKVVAVRKEKPEEAELMKNALSSRTLAVYKTQANHDYRLHLINCLTAICGIFHREAIWKELLEVVQVQLNEDEDRLIEALAIIEKLAEYDAVRDVLVTVGVEFLGATHLALQHENARIHSQAVRTVSSFLTYFSGSEKYEDFCKLIPTLVDVCCIRTPSEENLTVLTEVLATMGESGVDFESHIESPVPIIRALHQIYGNDEEDESRRALAMTAFAHVVALLGEWCQSEDTVPIIYETLQNVLDVISHSISRQWEEAKDDSQDPCPSEDLSYGPILSRSIEAIEVLYEIATAPMCEKYLEILFSFTKDWENDQSWPRCYAGYIGLEHFIDCEVFVLRKFRRSIWDSSFKFWAETDRLLPVHPWVFIASQDCQKSLVNELLEQDPYLSEMTCRLVPFCIANALHPSGHVRSRVASTLASVATNILGFDWYPKYLMKESVKPFAEHVVTIMMQAWNLHVPEINDMSQFVAFIESKQELLEQQSEIFNCASQWTVLFSELRLPAQELVMATSLSVIRHVGNLQLHGKNEGAAKCIQVCLQSATNAIAIQFENNPELMRVEPTIPGVIDTLVSVIVRIHSLIEDGSPFYCSAVWRQILLESLGRLAVSGGMLEPYLEQALSIFISPMKKESNFEIVDDFAASGQDENDECFGMTFVEHGVEKRLKLDTSIWDDQSECLWGLKALLTSYGAENFSTLGNVVQELCLDFFNTNYASHPVTPICYFAISASLFHYGTRVLMGTLPVNEETKAEFLQNCLLLLDVSEKQFKEIDEDAEDDTGDAFKFVDGPLELCFRIFQSMARMIEGGMVFSQEETSALVDQALQKAVIPACKTASAYAETSGVDEEADRDISSFFTDLESTCHACLVATREIGFAVMKQYEIDVMWGVRLADEEAEVIQQTAALLTICHFISYGGEMARNQYVSQFPPVVRAMCLTDCSKMINARDDPHEDVALRQSATFAISVLFEHCWDQLTEDVRAELLAALKTAGFEHPLATDPQRRCIVECCFMGIFWYHYQKGSAAEEMAPYFDLLPIYADGDEVERLCSKMISMMNNNHQWVQDGNFRARVTAQIKKGAEMSKEFVSHKSRLMINEAAASL